MKRSPNPLTPLLRRLRPKPLSPGDSVALSRRRRLRDRLGSSRMPGARRDTGFSPARASLFVGTATLLSLLLCIHLWPNRVSWKLGDLADREIIAPRTVRYEDSEATRQLRDEAARQADKQYETIPNATVNALDNVRTVFDVIDRAQRLRQESDHAVAAATATAAASSTTAAASFPSAVENAKEVGAEIRRQASVYVPAPEIDTLLGLDSASRDVARGAAMHLVERVMGRSIADDGDDLTLIKKDLPRDSYLLTVPAPLRPPVLAVTGAVLTPTRRFEPGETERHRKSAQAAIAPQWQRISAGTAVIHPDERVTQRHLDEFAALGLQNARLDALTVAVIVTLVWGVVALAGVYLRLFHLDLYENSSHLLLLSVLSVISVAGIKVGYTLVGLSIGGGNVAAYLGMMCVASAGMVVSLLLSPRVALLLIALLSVASGLILNHELRFTVITLVSSLVGIVAVRSLRNRGDLLRAAVFVCGANALLNVLVGQLEGDIPLELGYGALWGVISGVFALMLFYLGAAAFEKPFGITTHLRLLELSDPATPVLQEFRMRVPGTYAHSLMVGNLAHAAAEAIGADALLVRVAAYYHDLGKMNRPEFFIENQSNAENIHDTISPSLSAIVLTSHVKEGLEIAEEVGLPPRVREVIQQHHGTTLMKYFYHRATGGLPNPTLESQFRYPGPKPQTREAAILMLADGVEAASRTLDRPTPARIADFVERMFQDKLQDGQLDECNLTLREVRTIQDVFARTLCGTLHARIEYPDHKTARQRNGQAASSHSADSPVALPTPVTLGTLRGESGNGLALTLVSSPLAPPPGPLAALSADEPLSAASVASVLPSASSTTNGIDSSGDAGTDAAAVGTRDGRRSRASHRQR